MSRAASLALRSCSLLSHAQELENFHQILHDISYGRSTQRVKDFIIQSFVKGMRCGNAHHAELEGSTAVFSKRRYRDRWNRVIVRLNARTRNHTARIKARVRARGVTTGQFFNERRTELCRAKARTPALWSLQLAGDWHPNYETKIPHSRPHYMRVMLTANLAVQDRMANGTFTFRWRRS